MGLKKASQKSLPQKIMQRQIILALLGMSLSACARTPPPLPAPHSFAHANYALPDKVQFLQTDKRWAQQSLGGTGESLKSDGCLVTSVAMALVNLGFRTDPGDLTNRLKSVSGFTKDGWLVWSGLEKATGGIAKTYFYNRKDDEVIRACLAAGYYPLVKFDLASRKTHWAMVVKEGSQGFYIRDPMVPARSSILLSSRASGIDAVRCIGVPAKA
ncbi:MAG: hypothetical protein V3U57_02545 [Robiginitomaculum sp.]